MKNRTIEFQKILLQPAVPFVVLWAVMLVFHLQFIYVPGDERLYGSVIAESGVAGMLSFLAKHYTTWSARLLTEALFCIFSYLPVLVWRIVNPVMIAALAWLTAWALRLEREPAAGWLICSLVFLYQWPYLADAGWIVTTIAYLWPAVFALAGMWGLLRTLRAEPVTGRQWLITTVALLFGANMEQPAIMLVLLFLVGVLWLVANRRQVPAALWGQLGVVCAALIFILTAPGNAARTENDIASFYPNFPMLSLVQKVEIGVSAAISSNVYGRDSIFFLFACLVALALWEQRAPLLARLAGLLPPLLLLPLSIFRYDVQAVFPQISFLVEGYSAAGFINLSNFGSLLSYLPMLLCYGIFVLCLLGLWGAFGASWQNALMWGLLALGGASQAAIGFTPSAGVSSRRTGFFFSVCIIAVCGLIWRTLNENGRRSRLGRGLVAVCTAFLCMVQCISLWEI